MKKLKFIFALATAFIFGGCERAAWLYEGNFNENRYEQVKKDAKKAKQMRKKACELGDKQSC